MKPRSHSFQLTLAAVVLAVGFSLPGQPLSADDARVDDLMEQLSEAEGAVAARIATEIMTEWSKSGSAAMDLLMRRGEDALDAGDPVAAIEHFTAAIDYDPAFTEAYHGRATAYYLNEDIGPAIDDLREVLARNPRHFNALQGFGLILGEMGREEEALEVLRRVLAIYPGDAETAQIVDMLTVQLEGEAL